MCKSPEYTQAFPLVSEDHFHHIAFSSNKHRMYFATFLKFSLFNTKKVRLSAFLSMRSKDMCG